MKIALITPNYHQSRGNTITVERISGGLQEVGISTEIVSVTEDNNFPELPAVDLVHGFNAYEFNRYWSARGLASYPYVITLTGTDINHALFARSSRQAVLQTLKASAAIHVFSKEAQSLLWQQIPGLENKTHIIPQGIQYFADRHAEINKEEDTVLFLLPAGIRKVKNIPAAISRLSSLYEKDARVRLWIVGPIIESEEGNEVSALVGKNSSWIRYWGEIPHANMGQFYSRADVVLNSSLSEGQSSAILEAMAMGIPVLASNVAGNRAIVKHEATGFLYSDESEFTQYVSQLMNNKELGQKMGLRGKQYIQNHHSLEAEIEALKNIYLKCLTATGISLTSE